MNTNVGTKTSAGTVEARDKALTADRNADAEILIAQAKLDSAKINLGYTDIVARWLGRQKLVTPARS